MTIIERRIVIQDWYETECTRTGWDTNTGWYFKEGDFYNSSWEIVEILDSDKYGNPLIGIAEKETEID